MKAIPSCCALLALSACATTSPPIDDSGEPRTNPDMQMCDDTGMDSHIGHTASAQMGAAMLAQSGARQLRWVPPRTAVTMDYRADRLTVSYDDDMVIDRVSCG